MMAEPTLRDTDLQETSVKFGFIGAGGHVLPFGPEVLLGNSCGLTPLPMSLANSVRVRMPPLARSPTSSRAGLVSNRLPL